MGQHLRPGLLFIESSKTTKKLLCMTIEPLVHVIEPLFDVIELLFDVIELLFYVIEPLDHPIEPLHWLRRRVQ